MILSVAPAVMSLRDQLLADLGRGTSDLPALPQGVTEALRLARSAEVHHDEIIHAAENDPPLAARLLSVANSALYGRSARVYALRGALVRLGLQATRDVLYQTAYASMLVRVPRYQLAVENSFHHGVRAAQLTRLLAHHRGVDPDLAYLAGLLHDLGRARCWKLLAARVDAQGDDSGAVAAVAELHPRAGAELAARWHLPDEVVQVCLSHHAQDAGLYPTLVGTADVVALALAGRETLDSVRLALARAGIDFRRAEKILNDAALEGAPTP